LSGNSIQFSPDGKLFVTACDDRFARIWQTETGMSVAQPMEHGNSIRFAQFSPDGKRIVTASWDGTARVWDAKTGTPLSDPLKHSNSVNFAEFSPNGERIVTASNDKTARIWDLVPSGEAWPEWLTRLAEAIAGQHLSDRGIVELPNKESAELIREIKDQLSREPVDDKWAIWGRWFLGDRSTRTITPFSKLTVPEYIRNCIEEHTRESLYEAEQLSAGNAQLLEQIVAARKSLPSKPGQ